MVKSGDCISNPITGERIEFLKTNEDTEGGLLQIITTVKAGAPSRAFMIQPVQDVHFIVKSGSLRLKTSEGERQLAIGQETTIQHGTPFTWWNSGEDTLITLMEFSPALQLEDLFVSLFALARAGKTDQRGVPDFLQTAVMARKYKYEVYSAKPSIRTQKLLYLSTAWFGRLIGYHADHPYHRETIMLEPGMVEGELATVPVENRCS